jgi:hypothetical protein
MYLKERVRNEERVQTQVVLCWREIQVLLESDDGSIAHWGSIGLAPD